MCTVYKLILLKASIMAKSNWQSSFEYLDQVYFLIRIPRKAKKHWLLCLYTIEFFLQFIV